MSLLDHSFGKRQAEGRRAQPAPRQPLDLRRFLPRREPALSPAIAFLPAYGISPDKLMQAMAQAHQAAIRPEAALMAAGFVSEKEYYRALARHLGLAFIDEPVELAREASFPKHMLACAAPLAERPDEPLWLLAPHGQLLDDLLTLHRRGLLPRERYAITTPRQLAGNMFAQRAGKIAHAASHDLQERFGEELSAVSAGGWATLAVFGALAAATFAAWLSGGFAWLIASFVFGLLMAPLAIALGLGQFARWREDQLPRLWRGARYSAGAALMVGLVIGILVDGPQRLTAAAAQAGLQSALALKLEREQLLGAKRRLRAAVKPPERCVRRRSHSLSAWARPLPTFPQSRAAGYSCRPPSGG